MNLQIREWTIEDIDQIVDYFCTASQSHLISMGVDPQKIPDRMDWIHRLQREYGKDLHEKEYSYVIWLKDGKACGHSNINQIIFGERANMHLHLWNTAQRQKGIGTHFLKDSIRHYFRSFDLKRLYCEPFANNQAPNRTLEKVGFRFVRSYETVPGRINTLQVVNRYVMTRKMWEASLNVGEQKR